MRTMLHLIVVMSAVGATLFLSRGTPALASCGSDASATHVNTNLGYISYLSTDLPAGWGNASLFATPDGYYGDPVNNHAIGVWYSSSGWTVFNEDISSIPQQAKFNVLSPCYGLTPTGGVYTHVATASNSAGDFTLLDNPVSNNNPNAFLLVSSVYTSDHPVYDTHALGVWYSTSNQKWGIFHEDGSVIPANAAYYVYLSNTATAPYTQTIAATSQSLWYGEVVIDNPFTNNNPAARITLTQDWNPSDVFNPHLVGVGYNGVLGKWMIYNVDGSNIPVNANFFYTVY